MAVSVTFGAALLTWDGFGASSAFAIPFSTAVADFLFRTDVGIGLSLLREEITANGYPNCQTTDGNPAPGSAYAMWSGSATADDHSYSVAQQAYARGATIWGTLWTFQTAWQGGSANGALAAGHWQDGANLFQSYISQAWSLGVPISYVGICNEPDITPSYAQTAWSTSNLVSWVKQNVGPTLATWGANNPTWRQATGLMSPGIIVAQVSTWTAFSTWVSPFESDATALGYIAKYGVHQYSGGGANAPPSPCSRAIWQGETFNQGGAYDTSMTQAMTMASQLYNAINTGQCNAWHYWFAEDVSDNNNSGLVGTNAVNWNNQSASLADWNAPTFGKRAYMVGNFSKFIRPGWQQVAISGAPAGVNILAFQSPNNNSFAIVCINTNGTDNVIMFNVTGTITSGTITPWVTNAANNLVAQATVSMTSSSFTGTAVNTGVTSFVYSDPGLLRSPSTSIGHVRGMSF